MQIQICFQRKTGSVELPRRMKPTVGNGLTLYRAVKLIHKQHALRSVVSTIKKGPYVKGLFSCQTETDFNWLQSLSLL